MPILVAAASAHAAGVSASLLCDRVEHRLAIKHGRDLATDGLNAEIADVTCAAQRLTSSIARLLASLEPEMQPKVAAITDAAYQTRLLMLMPADSGEPRSREDLAIASGSGRTCEQQPPQPPTRIARALRETSRMILPARGLASRAPAASPAAEVMPPHTRRGGHVGRCPDPENVPHSPGPAASDSHGVVARAEAR
jgi:hypothetical protein